MTKQAIIDKTVNYLNVLPDNKIEEILDYVEYLTLKHDDTLLNAGILNLVSKSKSFEFLKDEEDLYKLSDIKEKYE
jgi:hypothetical protein